jgi:hypothetical protein
VLLNANEATDVISNYAEAIGDVEQTLAGVDDAIDQLIRRDKTAAASPNGITNFTIAVTKEVKSKEPDAKTSYDAESIEQCGCVIRKRLRCRLGGI